MDAKVTYWTVALLNMAVVVALAVRGVIHVRRGDVLRHRRSMIAAAALVSGFVLSYACKLVLLGSEDLTTWSPAAIFVLRIHECCVFTMLVAALLAGSRAWMIRGTRRVTGRPSDPAATPRDLAWHRRTGWTAVTSAILGLISACLVLAGIYARSAI